MKIVSYIFRFVLAIMFIWAGIEKLFLPYDPSVFKANSATSDPLFFEFYDLLHGAGYLYFVGFFQLICGLLVAFKRTYLLGSVMLIPLMLCLIMTHVFISKNTFYMIFDGALLVMISVLVFQYFKPLKELFLQKQKTLI